MDQLHFSVNNSAKSVGFVNVSREEDISIENFELASKGVQHFLVVLYSLTAAFALLGNVLSIVVLTRGKRSSRDLRLFLVNLSLSDILMSIFSIPFTYTNFIMGRWIFSPQACPLVQAIQVISVFVSIYTLTIIGIDRYIAISRPFIVNFWSKSFAPVVVFLTWLFGFLLSLIIWFSSTAEPFIVIKNITYYDCHENWSNKGNEQIYTVALFLIVFAIPLLCLLFFYGSICLKLWRHSAPGNANIARDAVQSQAKIKVIKMLITIVLLFAICWFPIHLFQLIRIFNNEALKSYIGNDASSARYLIIVISSHWLSMANSFVNPMIYCFMSDNFRTDIKHMAKKCILWPKCLTRIGNGAETSQIEIQTRNPNLDLKPNMTYEMCPLFAQQNNGCVETNNTQVEFILKSTTNVCQVKAKVNENLIQTEQC